MPFQIDKSFVVRAPAGAVWEFLTDPKRVARCLPGAAITDQVDERTWAGTLTVKVGPVSASYRGRMSFARLDAEGRSAEIVASGQDVRGKGGASMRLTSRLTARAASETEVVASSELNVTGLLAQMGRGMIQDVGDQIFGRFTDAMRAELEAPAAAPAAREAAPAPPERAGPRPAAAAPPVASAAAPPIDLLSMGAGAASRATARSLRRPEVWVPLAVLAIAALWLLARART